MAWTTTTTTSASSTRPYMDIDRYSQPQYYPASDWTTIKYDYSYAPSPYPNEIKLPFDKNTDIVELDNSLFNRIAITLDQDN